MLTNTSRYPGNTDKINLLYSRSKQTRDIRLTGRGSDKEGPWRYVNATPSTPQLAALLFIPLHTHFDMYFLSYLILSSHYFTC